MASSAKRLKLSRRKNHAELDVTQTETSKSINKNDQNQNTVNEDSPSVSKSLQSLRKKLKECLPALPEWKDFSGFPELDELPSATKHPDDSHSKEKRVVEKATSLSTTSTNLTEKSNTVSGPSTSANTQKRPSAEINSEKIQQCPLCPIFFPHDWSQQEINSHVNSHLDAEDFE